MTDKELIDLLAVALMDARENMAGWGEYASEYFKWKWDLAGDLQQCDDAIALWKRQMGK